MIRKVYKKMRKHGGQRLKSFLSKTVFDIGLKPTVKLGADFQSGLASRPIPSLIISADFEMAWAFRYSRRNVDPIALAGAERTNIPKILKLLEEYSIPITWATVGHLFLESCKPDDHAWMRRIPHFDGHWRFMSGDWFDHDPHTDYRHDSAWYAPDLVEIILKSRVSHEFGCHTFSHIDCTDINCPSGVFEDEINASIQAATNWGISLRSMVFPGGTAGNFEVLKRLGFQVYRKHASFDLAYPYMDETGLIVTYSSASFGCRFDWSSSYYIKRFIKIIDKAIATRTAAHIWFHPSLDEWTLQNVMPEVFKYAAEKREEGSLWIGTMGQIARYVNGVKS